MHARFIEHGSLSRGYSGNQMLAFGSHHAATFGLDFGSETSRRRWRIFETNGDEVERQFEYGKRQMDECCSSGGIWEGCFADVLHLICILQHNTFVSSFKSGCTIGNVSPTNSLQLQLMFYDEEVIEVLKLNRFPTRSTLFKAVVKRCYVLGATFILFPFVVHCSLGSGPLLHRGVEGPSDWLRNLCQVALLRSTQ